MGDDTDDKRKGEGGRETFETVPPELRPYYVPGPSDKIDLAKNPRLAAIRAGLEILDQFEEAERRVATVKGSTKAHVAPVAIPQPSRPRSDPPAARVEISVPEQEGQVLRFDRARVKSTNEPAAPSEDEQIQKPSAASPWTKPASAEDVRASALPSSLRPRASDDAPASELPAGVPQGPKRRTAITAAVLGVGVLLFGVVLFRGPSAKKPTDVHGAPPATAKSSAPVVASAEPVASTVASVSAEPVKSAEPAKSAEPVKSAEPAPVVTPPKPKKPGVVDDPYDASAPSPAVTATPTATPSATVAPSTPPPAPQAPPTASSEKPVYD